MLKGKKKQRIQPGNIIEEIKGYLVDFLIIILQEKGR